MRPRGLGALQTLAAEGFLTRQDGVLRLRAIPPAFSES